MGWISVKDRLPEKGGDFLVTDGHACMVLCFRDRYNGEFDNYDGKIDWWDHEIVTHWMTIPEPPNNNTNG